MTLTRSRSGRYYYPHGGAKPTHDYLPPLEMVGPVRELMAQIPPDPPEIITLRRHILLLNDGKPLSQTRSPRVPARPTNPLPTT